MTHILNMKQGLHPQNYTWGSTLFPASPRQFPEFKSLNFSTKSTLYKPTQEIEKIPAAADTNCEISASAEPISQYSQILSTCRKKKRRRRRRNKKKNKKQQTNDESCRRNSVEVLIDEAPRIRERSISMTSDDSFVICFEGDSSSETGFPRCRQRQISTASDDSFICFEGGAASALSFDDNEVDESALSSDDENSEDVDSCESLPNKKVRFAEELCHVYPMIKWSFAYQSARKGPWEECARDRDRFNRRIKETEQKLAPIFNSEHRTKVYNQRFVDGAAPGSEI